MIAKRILHICVFVLLGLLNMGCRADNSSQEIKIIPLPQEYDHRGGVLDLSQGFDITIRNEKLEAQIPIIKEQYQLFFSEKWSSNSEVELVLMIDTTMDKEEYAIDIDKNMIIKGGSITAVRWGINTFWQSIDQCKIKTAHIVDKPKHQFRGFMVDCARQWHPIDELKKIINLCSWYKLNYLQLHLTDDQLFTFSSDHYPELASKGTCYTKDELRSLDEYAYQRGVTLIPEIDVPAHASAFIRAMPETFGLADVSQNSYTMSLANERGIRALDTLFGELASVFRYSPYLHMGGDEAHFDGMKEDFNTKEMMKSMGYTDMYELFHFFINRVNKIIKNHGKKTLIWAGFKRECKVKIPNDIIVVSWESQYYNPQDLLDDGYDVINSSFTPLYIVNNRKWLPSYIYEAWDINKWGFGTKPTKKFQGITTDKSDKILGAMMCSWEQNCMVEIMRARDRLAAFGEKLWCDDVHDFGDFQNRLKPQNKKLECLLYGFKIGKSGLVMPDSTQSNFYEHLRFDKELVLNINPNSPDWEVRFELKDTSITKRSRLIDGPISANDDITIKLQAFDQEGDKVGFPYYRKYSYYPLRAIKNSLEVDRIPSSWERLRFNKEMKITLESPCRDCRIEYTINENGKDHRSGKYETPLLIHNTARLNAKLLDKDGGQIGSALNESYYLVKQKECLTTGKKTWASNEDLRPRMANIATNGRVSLWEHWSDHKGSENWIKVDLGSTQKVSFFELAFFWDNYRYYQYTIESSIDGDHWVEVVDASENESLSTMTPYKHEIDTITARYLKLNILYNSANPGLHVSEFCAY